MGRFHVIADHVDHLGVGLAPGHETALALDNPGHHVLLQVVYAHAIGTMLA